MHEAYHRVTYVVSVMYIGGFPSFLLAKKKY